MVSILRLRGKPTGAVVAVGLLDLVDMTAKLLLRPRGRQAKRVDVLFLQVGLMRIYTLDRMCEVGILAGLKSQALSK